MSLIVDGITYDVPVVSMKRVADFLYKFAERTQDGELHSEMIGVYYNYQLTLGESLHSPDYEAAWIKLSEPTPFHTVVVPNTDGSDSSFSAYFAKVTDELKRTKNGVAYWKSLTVNFTAKSPARIP